MSTKFGRVVTYNEELPLTKLHDPSITWVCEVTVQTKTIVSALPYCPWSPNLGQNDDIPSAASTHKVPQLFGHVFFQGLVRN